MAGRITDWQSQYTTGFGWTKLGPARVVTTGWFFYTTLTSCWSQKRVVLALLKSPDITSLQLHYLAQVSLGLSDNMNDVDAHKYYWKN